MKTFRLLACLLFSIILVYPCFAADLDHAKTLFEEESVVRFLRHFK